jgi:hypothetical protein
MNLLLVTRDIKGAELVKNELSRLLPDLQLQLSLSVQDAAEQLSRDHRFGALLLDSGFQDEDLFSIIRKIRAEDKQIVVIGLAAPSDLDSVVKLTGAGADDCVLKRPGFVSGLPDILRRASSRYPRSPEQDPRPESAESHAGVTKAPGTDIIVRDAGYRAWQETIPVFRAFFESLAPEECRRFKTFVERLAKGARDSICLELATPEGPSQRVELRAIPSRRDLAGATCVLLREPRDPRQPETSVGTRLPGAHTLRRPLGDQLQAQRQSWEQRLTLEQRLQTLQEERTRLQQELQAAQEKLEHEIEMLHVEREQREMEASKLKEQVDALEAQCSRLEDAANTEEELRKAMEEGHTAKMQNLEAQKRKAETESAQLQEALHEAEAQIASQTEVIRNERTQLDQQRIGFKQQLEKIQESYAILENAVLLESQRQERLADSYSSTLTHSETAIHELKRKQQELEDERLRLQSELNSAETRLRSQAEQFRTAQEQWESTQTNLEQQRSALEARIIQLEEARMENLAKNEDVRRELETRADALADELRRAQDAHSRSVEEFESERLRLESSKSNLEMQRDALEEGIRLAESRCQSLLEETERYKTRWQSSKSELDQRRLEATSLARQAHESYNVLMQKLRELSGESAEATEDVKVG